MLKTKKFTILISSTLIFLTFAVIINPKESFEASTAGLGMWWEIVFPSLLPFFILSELLICFGVVSFVGVLLEPFMRPLFRVPGMGAFVLAMGMASGFPSGAKLTSRLRKENQLTKTEAERLVCFTNSSNPLFIFGAISVGFFQHAALGIVLATAHYLSNLAVGITMRFYGGKETRSRKERRTLVPSITLALEEMHRKRMKETRPFGKILSEAIVSSVQTLLMIGGFIIIFSVLNRMLSEFQILPFISILIKNIFAYFHLSAELSIPLLSGFFEITTGSRLVSETEADLFEKAIIVSFILGFGGFSVQAQVAGILAETDIAFKPYFIARILQAAYAAILVAFLWKPLYTSFSSPSVPVFFHRYPADDRFFAAMWENFISAGPILTIVILLISAFLMLPSTKTKRVK
jgi:sporulation integral membrane protein YlbJ